MRASSLLIAALVAGAQLGSAQAPSVPSIRVRHTMTVTLDPTTHRLAVVDEISIPPGTQHYPEVVGNQTWIAVAAYCDDCPIIAQAKK